MLWVTVLLYDRNYVRDLTVQTDLSSSPSFASQDKPLHVSQFQLHQKYFILKQFTLKKRYIEYKFLNTLHPETQFKLYHSVMSDFL